MKGTQDMLGGQDTSGQGLWHMGDAQDMFGVVVVCQEGVQHVKKGWHMSKHIGTHRRGLQHAHEVMAGAGAHEGHVGCVWDGGSMLRGGWACQRGQGASRGMGHIMRGHGVTHHVSLSVRQFAWMQGWQRRCAVGVWTHVHKHGGHGRHDVVAATKQGEDAHVCVIIRGQQKLSIT